MNPGVRKQLSTSGVKAVLTLAAIASAIDLTPRRTTAQAAISFVQVNSATPQSSASVTVPYTSAQTGGDLNVVVVGWNDTTVQVSSVADTLGNSYIRAVGPTVTAGSATQSIYYAANIAAAAANANTVTVTFSSAATNADVRVAEYRGIATANPIDVTAAATGSSASSDSGAVATTNANDLLIGANIVQKHTTAAGASYTSRVITSPDGDILEDRIVTATGSYSASASISSTGWWIMQMVAFRAVSADTQAPTAPGAPVLSVVSSTQLDLTWPAATDNVGVTGYFIERCAGAGCSTFAQIGTSTTAGFSDTGLSASTSYSYRVRATDAANNIGPYSPTATATTQPPPAIAFVQVNSATPQSPTAIVTVPFATVQTGGDLNVVVVGWNDASATVQSVTDTKGNVYSRAVGPTVIAGTATQSIYYAANIAPAAANANSVTVTLNAPAVNADIRIAEYSGVATANPVDVAAAAQGSGAISDSGAVMTTSPNGLLVGANTVQTHATGPGVSYTQRVITSPDGDLLEDRVVTSTGSYDATAPISPAGWWIMQMVAFRAASADTQAPTAPGTPVSTIISSSQINLTWPAATDNVGVTGYLVERCAGAGCGTFAQVGTPAAAGFSDSGLSASTSYTYRVRAIDAANNTGPYSPTASATTPAPPDTQPPTAPGTPVPNVVSTTQINLTWAAATDNVGVTGYFVERCAGAGCGSFAQIGTSSTTSFNDTGLTASTTYNYRVRAADAANNLGPYSAIASATTQSLPDTQAPTAPGTPALNVVSSSQINLTWPPATDNVGVTAYLLERCSGGGCSSFAQIATPATASFNDTGLSASTSYSYRVRATDVAANIGPYSGSGTATTPAAQAISFVQVNSATPQSTPTSVPVTFTTAQTSGDLNVVVVGWNDATAAVQSVTDTKGNVYTRAVGPTVIAGTATQSIYYAANIAGATAGANTVTVDFTGAAPFPDIRIAEYSGIATVSPVDVTADAQGSGTLSDSGAVATTGASDLLVGANTVQTHATGPGASYTQRVITSPDGDILEDRTVTSTGIYNASAPMTSGWWIMQMVAFRGGTSVTSDTTPPTAPGTPVPSVISSNQINLTWPVATDNVGVTGYLVERCSGASCSSFAQIASPATASFNDTGLSPSISYGYRVRATDAASNIGPYSAVATATTPAPPDTQAPAAPGTPLPNVVSSTQINLTWPAATDNVGVTGYLLERCSGAGCSAFVQIATPATAGFNDTGLSASTSYSYRVRATDAANNLGPYSTPSTATTQASPDTQPPSAPGTPVPNVVSSTQINVTWPAATDNVGVTGYLLERCSGAGCSAFVQIATPTTASFNDTGLSASTSYSYRVRAADAANNLGPYSAAATALTSGLADLTLSKSHTGAFTQGQTGATYTLSVTNAGGSATTAAVTITDALPAALTATALSGPGWTCSVATLSCTRSDVLAAGASYPAVTLTVSVSSTAPSLVTNTAAVSGGGELNTSNDSASDVTTINGTDANPPTFVAEAHSAMDGTGSAFNNATLSLTVSGTNPLLIAAWHAEWDGDGFNAAPDSWTVTRDGVPGTLIAQTDGYNGGAGNGRFRLYYWLNPPAGLNTIAVSNPNTGPNELAVSAILLNNVASTAPLGPTVLDVSDTPRTSESETVATAAGDLVVHVIADAVCARGTLGAGETSVSVANDGHHCTAGDGDASLWVATKAGEVSTTTVSSSNWPSGPSPSPRVLNGVAIVVHGAVASQGPSAPANLVATAVSGTEIDLSWTASTDNIAVTGYHIDRCQGTGCSSFAEIAAPGGLATAFADTSVAAGTSYSYRVRAIDAAANFSPYSNTSSATTPVPDTQPPSVPGTLSATAVSGTQINLAWGPATDNVAVTGYLVTRCQGAGCTNYATIATAPGTTFNDTGLAGNTSYTYVVTARDAANNLGPSSNAASATTPAIDPTLVAAYSFDEGSGSTVGDSSGHGNTGTIANATWTTAGKNGNALSFNGTSARVIIAEAFDHIERLARHHLPRERRLLSGDVQCRARWRLDVDVVDQQQHVWILGPAGEHVDPCRANLRWQHGHSVRQRRAGGGDRHHGQHSGRDEPAGDRQRSHLRTVFPGPDR
jgi:phosphodiesterase/alkaline phosphatase D-like protein